MRVQNKQRASCFCFWNKSPPFQEGDLPKCNPQPSEKCPFNLPKQWRYVHNRFLILELPSWTCSGQRWAKWRSSTFYLYLYLWCDMSATSFTLKKGYDRVVSAYYLRPLEKSRYRAQCFFTLKRSLEILIVSDRSIKITGWGKAHILVHNY